MTPEEMLIELNMDGQSTDYRYMLDGWFRWSVSSLRGEPPRLEVEFTDGQTGRKSYSSWRLDREE